MPPPPSSQARHAEQPRKHHSPRELSDLEDAISTHRDAVHLIPDGHPDKPSRRTISVSPSELVSSALGSRAISRTQCPCIRILLLFP
ncbi:hypothetical protein L210DRAFT_3533932 [Boletus edulis BED1]|uniref:Uncharacterized protein n=1 Tax=Boletus edulis BED1 TaxID=1328754 RepID=A0AAD4GHK9_BOLED|nr:hypothetical protein L210DRAFT_3533932 [Boletus edulis BED1]